jgi:hypothetical protein
LRPIALHSGRSVASTLAKLTFAHNAFLGSHV